MERHRPLVPDSLLLHFGASRVIQVGLWLLLKLHAVLVENYDPVSDFRGLRGLRKAVCAVALRHLAAWENDHVLVLLVLLLALVTLHPANIRGVSDVLQPRASLVVEMGHLLPLLLYLLRVLLASVVRGLSRACSTSVSLPPSGPRSSSSILGLSLPRSIPRI